MIRIGRESQCLPYAEFLCIFPCYICLFTVVTLFMFRVKFFKQTMGLCYLVGFCGFLS